MHSLEPPKNYHYNKVNFKFYAKITQHSEWVIKQARPGGGVSAWKAPGPDSSESPRGPDGMLR